MGANGNKVLYTKEERRAKHLGKARRRLKNMKRIKAALESCYRALHNHDWGNLVGNQPVYFNEFAVEDMIAAQELLNEFIKQPKDKK